MTASNARTVLSMTPKFSKALLVAGLAAALVGCGGGSSTTTMDGGEPTEPTAAETAAQKLEAAHSLADSLVTGLSPTSGDAQKKAAQDAVDALSSLVGTTVGLSDTDKEMYEGYVLTLSMDIDTNTAPEMVDEPDEDTPTADASAWLRGVSTHRLGNVPNWPLATRLAGPTTNPDLRDGWTVTSYDYENGTTTHEKGKTFSMEVEKVTPEIEMTWTRLAALSPLMDRGEVINNYLGGPQIQLQAITETPDSSAVAGLEGTSIPVAGSGLVSTTITPGRVLNDGGSGDSSEFAEATTQVTQFRRRDFTAMTELDLESNPVDSSLGSSILWTDLDEPTGLIVGSAIPIIWNDIPGILGVSSSANINGRLRFNDDGFLEVSVNAQVAASDTLSVEFRPTSLANRRYTVRTVGIHDMPLTLREGTTETATTEFAYWASQNQSNSTITVSTFARGGMGDDAFATVTNAPQMLTGSAEYNGLAAGYYAMGTESNGEFTADAMLTANFGANTDSETITVSGMIDNFMPITGDGNLSSWNLTLSPFMLNDDNLGTAFSGRTSGGDALGNWNGQFLGSANPGINLEDAADRANDYPEAVVGNFTGHFANNGHVAGAFGADLEE